MKKLVLIFFIVINIGCFSGSSKSNPTTSTQNTTEYSVSYNGNGTTSGSVPIDINTYLLGDSVTVLGNTGGLTKTGYTFNGWNKQSDGNGVNYLQNQTFEMGRSDVILYANWTALTSDTTIPSISQFALTSPNPTVNQTVTFTIIASDNSNQINGYLITETSTKPSPYDSELPIGSWIFPKPTSYTFQNNTYEMKSIYLWVRDSSNNVSDSAKIVIDYNDYQNPKINSITVCRIGASNRNSISIDVSDDVGIVRYYVIYQDGAGTIVTYDSATPPSEISYDTGDITHTNEYWVYDKAGNFNNVTFTITTSAATPHTFTY